MKVKIIASGSKGNCTLVMSSTTKILIDAGVTAIHIKNSLESEGIDINTLDGVLISHTHSDHIKGLVQIVKKYGLKVYATPQLLYDLIKIIPIESIIVINENFEIGDINILLMETSHDVMSYGFVIENKGTSMVYITDTGYINIKNHKLTLKDFIVPFNNI